MRLENLLLRLLLVAGLVGSAGCGVAPSPRPAVDVEGGKHLIYSWVVPRG